MRKTAFVLPLSGPRSRNKSEYEDMVESEDLDDVVESGDEERDCCVPEEGGRS